VKTLRSVLGHRHPAYAVLGDLWWLFYWTYLTWSVQQGTWDPNTREWVFLCWVWQMFCLRALTRDLLRWGGERRATAPQNASQAR